MPRRHRARATSSATKRFPLLALDFYRMAKDAFSRPGAGDYSTRIGTRVADAQELTGNVEAAIATYEDIAKRPPQNPPTLVTWFRTVMKVEYYHRLQERRIVIRLTNVRHANILLGEFNAALQADPRYASAIAANDLHAYESVICENALTVRAQMMTDAEAVGP